MDREITELPVLQALKKTETKKKKYCIRIQILGDWLVIDCYRRIYDFDNDWEYMGRYCIDREGRHGRLKGRKLDPQKLTTVLNGKYTFTEYYKCEKETGIDAAEEYDARKLMGWNRKYPNSLAWEIGYAEEDYDRRKRMTAEQRKQDRIDKLMSEVPLLSEGFYDFLRKTVFPEDYMIPTTSDDYTETGNCYCSACRKVHSFEAKPKIGSMVLCTVTQRYARILRRGTEKHDKARVMVLQDIDEEKSVARHMEVYRTESGEMEGYSTWKYDEQARILLYREKFNGDLIRIRPADRCYHGTVRGADEVEQEWKETNPLQTRPYRWPEYLCPIGIREALKGTRYEKAPLEEMTRQNFVLKYNEVLLASTRENLAGKENLVGILEYMVKMGLRRMVQETVDKKMTDGIYYGTLNMNGKSAPEIFGCSMQRIRRLKNAGGGYAYLDWMRYEEQKGLHIKEEVVNWLVANSIYPDTVTPMILDLMSPEQVKNYLIRETQEYTVAGINLVGGSYTVVLNEWKDYLSMAKRLKMDIKDPIIHRTKHLKARHDALVEVFESQKDDVAAREMAEKFPEVDAACMAIRKKFAWDGEPEDEYCIIVPQGIKDIMQDSRQLHHCAGSSERYYERIEEGETYLVFLRKKSEPEKAYYTLEVEPGGTVRQKRSEYNRQPDLDAVTAFLKKWQKEVRARLKAEDLAEAEESRKKRIEEMAALQASSELRDQKLFKALSEDLNEADYGQMLASAV